MKYQQNRSRVGLHRFQTDGYDIRRMHKNIKGFLLVIQLEFVPLQFLWSERVAFVSGKLKHMGAGVFMNSND